MIGANLRRSVGNIRASRTRSGLTILGVVIGVASIVLAINIGQGVRSQVLSQLQTSGDSVLSVRSGRVVERNDAGEITNYNLNRALSSNTITVQDLDDVNALPSVAKAAPLAEISAEIESRSGARVDSGYVVATNNDLPELFGRSIEFGENFGSGDTTLSVIIGTTVALELFGDQAPIGSVVKIKDQDFIVKGVYERFPANPINLGIDYNRAAFISFDSLSRINNENPLIKEVLVKSTEAKPIEQVAEEVRTVIRENHGQDDFSVLLLSELEFVTEGVFELITALVAAVAAISLIVGGIGIMNIMLVNVAERTREIGIRKAIGASNWQILNQFLTESIVLSVVGGFVGVLLSQSVGLVMRLTTSIEPAFSPQVIGYALLLSVVVGVVFGAGPALKASRKKPIDALRS